MPLKDVARITHLGWHAVKEIVKADLAQRFAEIPLRDVKYIAIDEVYMGKSTGYKTIVIDLVTGRILWVGAGKGGGVLGKFWRKLRTAKARIRAVACDMSAAYWSAVLKHLPKAALVFDRFHIVKLANERIDDLRRAIQREAEVLDMKVLKGYRYLLLMGKENVPEDKAESLERALEFNKPLSTAYYLKEELRTLWDMNGRREARIWLNRWLKRAISSGISQMISLAKTLRTHINGILNYYYHPITSGKMEGINNKIGALTRASYGYRDDDFLVLKLYSLHESKFKLSGV